MFPLCFCCRKGLHSAGPQLLADYMFFLQLNEMLRNPGEGHFWQVDHIKPVYEGGGQCSLDNLQTLCTMCHREVSDNHTCVLIQAAPGGNLCTRVGEAGQAYSPIWEQMWGASWHWLCGSVQSRMWGGCYPLHSFSEGAAQWVAHSMNTHGSRATRHCSTVSPNLNLAFADL